MRRWSTRRRRTYEAWRVGRFWSRVACGSATACWPWMGPRMWSGYGKATLEDHTQNAHRVAYMLTHGAIAGALHVDHLCRNKICCNPAHLEAVSHRENARRRSAVKTHCPAGHPYAGANLYRWQGERQCRLCRTAAAARARRKRRAA